MDGFGYPLVMVDIAILVKIKMTNKKIILSTLISILHVGLCLLLGDLGWYIQLMFVPVFSILTILISINLITSNKKLIGLILLPFYLIYTISSIYLQSISTYPIWILGIVLSILFLVVYNKNKQQPYLFILLVIFILSARYLFMPSYFSHLSMKKDFQKYNLENLSLVDEKGNKIDIKALKGKTLLFDIWNTGCGVCIKKFPQLDYLNKKYAADTMVRIFSLNIPIARDGDKNLSIELTKQYSFQKIFFKYPDEHKKLFVTSVPLILIINKELKCVFASGSLNIESNVFVGNTETMMTKIKEL